MIINSLRLKNFKNYRGENLFDFSLPETESQVRNVILVGGLNGAGKTSMLEAIRLCLYGRRLDGGLMKDSHYGKMIVSKVNKNAITDGKADSRVQLDITLDEESPPLDVSIMRSWSIDDGKLIAEDFRLESKGKELEIVPREMWEDYVFSLIPPHVSDFFFFDGERIKRLASGEESDRILRDAIHDLFGLGRLDALESDLVSLVRRIRRRNVGNKRLRDSLTEVENELSKLKMEYKQTVAAIEDKNSLQEDVLKRLSIAEQDLRRKAGRFATMRDEHERKRTEIERNQIELQAELMEICEKFLPFLVASQTSSALIAQLRLERKIRSSRIASEFLKDVNRRLSDGLEECRKTRNHITDQQFAEVIEVKDRIMSEIADEIESPTPTQIIHDISETESNRIETFLARTGEDINDRLRGLLEKREKNEIRLKEIIKKLGLISRDIPESEISVIAKMRSEISTLGNSVMSLYEKRGEVEESIRRTEGRTEDLEEQIVCIDDDRKKIEVALQAISSIKELKTLTVSRKTADLEKKISEAHRQLTHKKELVKKINIDPVSFSTVLVGPKGEEVKKESISAGEQEMYALSVLWGLADASGYRMPMIIDAPLAKLDSNHARNMITKFFPSASHQVILLSQDREIDADLYGELQDNLARTYTLSLDEENKIQEGYFFD